MSNFYQNVANTVASNNADRQNAASLGTFASTALQVYQQHLQQQKLDTLANMYMASANSQNDENYAVQNAKPATAVSSDDPDLQGTADYNADSPGPVFQYNDGAGPGDHLTDTKMAADNASQGYGFNTNPTLPSAPGDVPANGGLAGLKLSMLMNQNRIRNALLSARTNAALARSGAINDPNSLAAQRLGFEKDREARIAAGGVRGGGQPKGPSPQADSLQKIDSDLNTNYGYGLNDFRSAGPEDTMQQNNGVLYRLGGGKGANGVVQPKANIFMPQDEHDQIMQRYNAVMSGHPGVVNQPQINAVRAFQSGGGTGNAAASIYQSALGPGNSALNMYQTHLGVQPGTTGTPGAAPPTAGALQQAQSIKAQVKAGTLSQTAGIAQLQQLGFD